MTIHQNQDAWTLHHGSGSPRQPAASFHLWCSKSLEQKRWRDYERDVQALLNLLQRVALVGVSDVGPDVCIEDDAPAQV